MKTVHLLVHILSTAGNTCFIAKCMQHCGDEYPFCGRKDLLEGSVAAELPFTYEKRLHKYPYGRSYMFRHKVFLKVTWCKDCCWCLIVIAVSHAMLMLYSGFLCTPLKVPSKQLLYFQAQYSELLFNFSKCIEPLFQTHWHMLTLTESKNLLYQGKCKEDLIK